MKNQDLPFILYRCFILSNFNYCPLVWHFCGIEDTKKMERIQERALRFVYSDFTSTYDQLLKKGNHNMLYIHRLKMMAVEVFKSINNLNPKYIGDLIHEKKNQYELRTSHSLTQPKCKSVKYGLNTFSYKGPKIWNSLPFKIKNAVSLNAFKKMIREWDGISCQCTMCSKMLSISCL